MAQHSRLRLSSITALTLILLTACGPQSTISPPPSATAPPATEAPTLAPTDLPAPTPTSEPRLEPTEEPQPGPIVVTDGLGRQVTLAAPAQRVVSLAPSNTEILFAIGAGPQVVGRDEFTNFPEEAQALPSVGGSFGDYNAEAIVDLEPDLVLAAEINPPELVESLEALGLTVFLLSNPTDLAGMYDNLELVGVLTDRQAEAVDLVGSLEERVAAALQAAAQAEERPTVFYEIDGSDPNAPWTTGPGTFIDSLITMAGGTNISADLDTPYAQYSVEALVAQNPEIILLGDAIYGVSPEDVAQRPGWEALDAVQSNRIFPFNDDLVSRPGPRLVDGLELLVELLHP